MSSTTAASTAHAVNASTAQKKAEHASKRQSPLTRHRSQGTPPQAPARRHVPERTTITAKHNPRKPHGTPSYGVTRKKRSTSALRNNDAPSPFHVPTHATTAHAQRQWRRNNKKAATPHPTAPCAPAKKKQAIHRVGNTEHQRRSAKPLLQRDTKCQS
jgi:hypothetical protein